MKAETQPDSIVTLTEAAAIIGVTRPGAGHIAEHDSTFPAPLCSISNGKTVLFWRRQIETFRDERNARIAAEAEAKAAAAAAAKAPTPAAT